MDKEILHEPDGCPKCGHELVYAPCPFSGWLRCASEDCGVCFDEEGNIITGRELIGKRREIPKEGG